MCTFHSQTESFHVALTYSPFKSHGCIFKEGLKDAGKNCLPPDHSYISASIPNSKQHLLLVVGNFHLKKVTNLPIVILIPLIFFIYDDVCDF